jgi:hypothetical protein
MTEWPLILPPVSIQQIKEQAASLSEQQRRELIGYLLSLGRKNDPAYWDRIAAGIADGNPGRWVAEEGLDAALRLNKPTA